MEKWSKLKDPGIFLTVLLALYSVFVFAWWPTDIYWAGVSLVGWLMFIGLFFWLLLGIIYVVWIERIDEEQKQ